MRRFLIFYIGILVLVSWNLSYAQDIVLFNLLGNKNGELLQNKISREDLNRMPSWEPKQGNPPLNQRQAIDIALSYVEKKYPQFIDAKISEVKLVQFLLPEYYKDKWYYNVILMNNIPVRTVNPDFINIVVMLDGTVNEPVSVKK